VFDEIAIVLSLAKKFVIRVVDNWPRLRTIRRVSLLQRVTRKTAMKSTEGRVDRCQSGNVSTPKPCGAPAGCWTAMIRRSRLSRSAAQLILAEPQLHLSFFRTDSARDAFPFTLFDQKVTIFAARDASRACSHATWGPTTERNDSRRPGRGTEAAPLFCFEE
jgi:hypothetical protein